MLLKSSISYKEGKKTPTPQKPQPKATIRDAIYQSKAHQAYLLSASAPCNRAGRLGFIKFQLIKHVGLALSI